jgi:hypothetical protein
VKYGDQERILNFESKRNTKFFKKNEKMTTQWLWVYNNERPHFALGGIPLRWRNKMTVNSQASTLELYGKWGYYKYAQTNDFGLDE